MDAKDPDLIEEEGSDEGPIVRHIVKDFSAVARLRKIQAKADARERRDKLKAEIAHRKLAMSSGEKARTHIAQAAPLYLLLLVGGFIVALATDALSEDHAAVASALLTLLATGLLANLRSIVTSNGHRESRPSKSNGGDDA